MKPILILVLATTVFAADAAKSLLPPAGSVALPLLTAHAHGYQSWACTPDGNWKSFPIAGLVTQRGDTIRHFRDTNPDSPAWQAEDSSVVHALLTNGKPDQMVPSPTPGTIPDLGLNTVPGNGKGTFGRITYLIRTHNKGGDHPEGPCQLAAGTRLVKPYQADYLFYTR